MKVKYITEIRTGVKIINKRGKLDYKRIQSDKLPRPHPLLRANGQVSNLINLPNEI